MYTTSRCSLCYALLSPSSNTTNSTISYPSLTNRRQSFHCSPSSIERLISSSKKLEKLWQKNDNKHVHFRSICYRCCDTIGQIEQIQNQIEQLSDEERILIEKLEHHLTKRAQILRGQRQRIPHFTPLIFNRQSATIDDDDDDTEEGEEKPRTVIKINGHGHSSSSLVSTTTLVGAKRRKSKVAHKINIENKPFLLDPLRRSNSPLSHSSNKYSPSLLFDSHPSKHSRSSLFSSNLNGHNNDLANLSFNSAYKSLALPSSSNSATTPPFIDPTTGALIAIVSNPHHAALLAQQHQQMFKSSSITPSSSNSLDDHDLIPSKSVSQQQQQQQKKFPCQLCGRDFSNKSNLNRHHSIVHVALRNFECTRCPKKFKLRQGLKTHMQRCHGVNTDEPTFVLQKHPAAHHHHHPSSFAQSK